MRVLTVAVCLLLGLAVPAAAQTPQQDLDRARAEWAAAGIADYAYTLRFSCHCDRNGKPSEAVVQEGVPESEAVERLFEVIQDALDQRPWKFSATYGEHGVPVTVSVDSYEDVAGDSYGFTVEGFRRLPSRQTLLERARAAWKASGIRRHSMVVTRRCIGRRAHVRRDRTVPGLFRFIAHSPRTVVRYGRHGIPRRIVARGCTWSVTRFRRVR